MFAKCGPPRPPHIHDTHATRHTHREHNITLPPSRAPLAPQVDQHTFSDIIMEDENCQSSMHALQSAVKVVAERVMAIGKKLAAANKGTGGKLTPT